MGRVCIVNGCPGRKRSDERYSLHMISLHKREVVKKWLELIDVKAEITEKSRICSLHFNDDCFAKGKGGKRLLLNSIPLPYKVGFNI